MTKAEENKAKGQIDRMKREAKDQFGNLTNDKKKQASEKRDIAEGEAKKKMGEFQDKYQKTDEGKQE